MRTPTRLLAALALAILSALAVFAPPASATKPVEIGQCHITIHVLGSAAVTIPICSNGPPL